MPVSPSAGGARIFLLFALGYALSYALRTVNAVIAPDLVAQFGLSNAQLGALSSAYFFSFAAMQLPLGIWLDRYGSRKTDAALLAIAALGCLVFALATESWMLGLGRAIIGVGVSGALMAAFRAFRFWFPPEGQQRLAAWMLMAGSMGALVSTVPAQALLPLIGWRGIFLACALLLALSSLALIVLMQPEPEQPPSSLASQWGGYAQVFREPYFWRFAVAGITLQASFISFQSLWAGPWFTRVLGLSAQQSAQALLVFNLVLMLAYLVLGWAASRLSARGWSTLRVVAIGSVLMVAAQIGIALVQGPWAWLMWLPLAVGVTTFTLAHSHVSLSFPSELTGRAFSAFNLMLFVGMFISQWAFGALVDALGAWLQAGEALSFRAAMAAWALIQALGLAVMLGWRVSPPQPAGPDPSGSARR